MKRALGGPTRRCSTDACGPTATHAPVSDAEHQCSLGVSLQPAVDAARRVVHEAGLRPYRVFLVWQERGFDRQWQTVRELELLPVKAVGMSEVQLEVGANGVVPSGPVKLRQLSPQQVNEDILRGWLDGEPWAASDPNRTWFYEVRLHQRCEGDPEPRRRRFSLVGEPELKAETFEFVVRLTAADVARDRAGQDATVAGRVFPGVTRPPIVT